MRMKNSFDTSKFFAYLFVLTGALIMLAPFYFMFVFATHSRTEIFSMPPPLWFGSALLDNMSILTEKIPFWKNLGWSLYVAIASTVLTLLFCSMAGYAFALMDFKYKNFLFAWVLGTMLIPSFMNMIPTFMVMDLLGWIDEHRALYLPGAAGAFGIFLMRQFASTAIPKELIEAARMDGAGPMRFFKDILLPLSATNIAALFVIQFIYGWNQYLWPLLVTTNEDMYPIVMGIKRMLAGEAYTEWNVVMATAILAMLPPALVVILMQKWFVKGLVDTEK